MATDTAATARSPSTRPDPRQRLWQVPMFVVGVAAFVGTYQGWLPLSPRDPALSFRRDIAGLVQITAKQNPDLNELKQHLARVAPAADAYPVEAAQAHFALGSGYVRLAELTAEPSDALNCWTLALQHFEAVNADQLHDANDGPRFAYRAAKARAAVRASSATPAELDLTRRLLITPPNNEDPGDGQRLAAELSLRLIPPDLQQAKNSLTTYIAETNLSTPPASIARAKLRLSDVHRQLGDIDGAKKWLNQIGPDAPPDVLPTAKAQLARIRMAEGDYPGARREWEQLIAIASLSPSLKATASYFLGVCLLSNKPPDPMGAARRFEEVARGEGVEGSAAAIRLAELKLKADEPARRKEAAGLLAHAVKGIVGPGDYPKNALLPLQEVQTVFEAAVQVLTLDGSYEAAVNAADSYKAVAVAGRDREKRAEALAAWAVSLKKSGGDSAAKFAAAADDYAALAALRSADTDKADLLHKAAALYRDAGNPNAAIALFAQILKLSKLPDETAGPILIEYAELLLSMNQPEAALGILKEVLLLNGPSATAVRYRIARHLIDTRNKDKVELGVALMDQIAASEKVSPAEQEMHERALVDSAYAYIQKGNFAEAEARLNKQVKLYAAGTEAGLGKLLLGVCLLQSADPRAKSPAPNPAKNREEAMRLFKLVVEEVDARKKANQSVERDSWLRTQANLRMLQTYQQMGKPYDVLKEGDKLRQDFTGSVDELIVLSLMYHAYKQLDKPEGFFAIHEQMRAVFEKLKDKPGAFRGNGGSEYSREYWDKIWINPDAAKTP